MPPDGPDLNEVELRIEAEVSRILARHIEPEMLEVIQTLERAMVPITLTSGELLGPTMKTVNAVAAIAYKNAYIDYLVRVHGHPREHALLLFRDNLGYYAGYYDNETRRRVEGLFDCEHPVFDSIVKNGVPTMEEAFRLGRELGERIKNEETEPVKFVPLSSPQPEVEPPPRRLARRPKK